MRVRLADVSDRDRIRTMIHRAFDAAERGPVADLAVALLGDVSDPRPLHLVAEEEGALLGHVAFSPVFERDTGRLVGHLLAPLAVDPSSQRQGIGSALVTDGLRRLRTGPGGWVFVYGDPAYYGRVGFDRVAAEPFVPPCPPRYPMGWQALRLEGGDVPPTRVALTCVAPLNDPDLW